MDKKYYFPHPLIFLLLHLFFFYYHFFSTILSHTHTHTQRPLLLQKLSNLFFMVNAFTLLKKKSFEGYWKHSPLQAPDLMNSRTAL